MPGTWLLRLIRACCDDHMVAGVFEPLVADWQYEARHARGLRLWRVNLSGGTAVLLSLFQCGSLAHVARQTPAGGFALAASLFAAAAVTLQLQPLQFTWRHWAWTDLSVHLFLMRADSLWLLPERLTFGILIAILPATVLTASCGWRTRSQVAAWAMTAGLLLVMAGWVAPLAREVRAARHWASVGRADPYANHPTMYATTQRLILRAMEPDAEIAGDARHTLARHASLIVAAWALGIVGAAIGRGRAAAHVPVGVRVVTMWWLFGWAVYRLLEYLVHLPGSCGRHAVRADELGTSVRAPRSRATRASRQPRHGCSGATSGRTLVRLKAFEKRSLRAVRYDFFFGL